MAFTEKFNKEVSRRFNDEGIDFAFPTQTLYLAGDSSRPLAFGIESEIDSINAYFFLNKQFCQSASLLHITFITLLCCTYELNSGCTF
jgi:hypothetical protein